MTANGCSDHPRRVAGCPPCQTIARMYERRRRSRIADGTWLYAVDAAEVQAHLDALVSAGMTVTDVAAKAGLPKSSVLGVRKRRFVQGPTAAALLAVKAEKTTALVPHGMVPVLGASRRVQALCWMGWSLQAQSDQVGMYLQQVWRVAHAEQAHVLIGTHVLFSDLFEKWSATRGPSKRAHSSAVRHGWCPPLAWDDIDDLQAEPTMGGAGEDVVDDVVVDRVLAGGSEELVDVELMAVLRTGVARGVPLSQLSQRLGVNYAGAQRMAGGELTPNRAKRARRRELVAS
jgi:hypothetical protein